MTGLHSLEIEPIIHGMVLFVRRDYIYSKDFSVFYIFFHVYAIYWPIFSRLCNLLQSFCVFYGFFKFIFSISQIEVLSSMMFFIDNNPKSAEKCFYKPREERLQFEIIVHVLVSSFRFIWMPMLWIYSQYKFVILSVRGSTLDVDSNV